MISPLFCNYIVITQVCQGGFRQAMVSAMVLPQGKPLLGVIPLEFMDLIVDPVRRELVGANGDKAVLMAM
jgi:hypothetical protein